MVNQVLLAIISLSRTPSKLVFRCAGQMVPDDQRISSIRRDLMFVAHGRGLKRGYSNGEGTTHRWCSDYFFV
jgi:hypothetical protein